MIRLDCCPHVVGLDFDNTVAMTKAGSAPGFIGVEEASRLTAERMFGPDGLRCFESAGGLQNRSPREFVEAIIGIGDPLLFKSHAIGFMERYHTALEGVIPAGKGRRLKVTHDTNTLDLLAEIYAREKLRILLESRCPEQAELAPGLLDFLSALYDEDCDCGILSAGHDEFIRRFFTAKRIGVPRMMTDDDVRGGPLEGAVKPDARLFEHFLTHVMARPHIDRRRVLYIGDDVERDGLLARNAGVAFGLYNPGHREVALWDGAFQFDHFTELAEAVLDSALIESVG